VARVDELHLMIGPNAVGAGTPVFSFPTRLDLLDVQRFENSPNVVLRYAATRPVSH
jgi:riboflavin biosynthesis pyrimidine reductase